MGRILEEPKSDARMMHSHAGFCFQFTPDLPADFANRIVFLCCATSKLPLNRLLT